MIVCQLLRYPVQLRLLFLASLCQEGARQTLAHHRVLSPVSQTNDRGAGAKNIVKCTCRRGSGPSAPARARFMSLIGCTRVLCRAVSWSSGMPDDNSEARALCVRRQCSRAAGSQQSSRARSKLSQRAALRPRPAWPAPPPPWPLLAVCAAAPCRQEVLCALVPIQCLPPACMHSGAGREMMRVGAATARKAGAGASSSHSFPGTRATDAMAARRWNSGIAIFQAA